MKQSDIISVVMVAVIGSIVAFVMVNMFLGEPQDVSYKTVTAVNDQLAEPDPEIFNYDAINPTVEVYVGTCTDTDGDGILSEEELEACKNEEEENPDNPDNPPVPEE